MALRAMCKYSTLLTKDHAGTTTCDFGSAVANDIGSST